MLTTWAKKVAAIAVNGGPLPHPTITANTSPAYIEAKSVEGNTFYIPGKGDSLTYTLLNVAVGERTNAGVMFGSGDKAESENDYTLESQIIGISATTPSIVTYFDSENYKYVARLDYAISNDTGAEITIREVGLLGRFYRAEQRGAIPPTGTQYRFTFLLDRTLLATPVTIADGDVGTVRYEFVY